jgi:TPR repeat protein
MRSRWAVAALAGLAFVYWLATRDEITFPAVENGAAAQQGSIKTAAVSFAIQPVDDGHQVLPAVHSDVEAEQAVSPMPAAAEAIEPPSGVQPAQHTLPPLSDAEAAVRISRARKYMANGSFASARLVYEELAQRGNAAGALELARSFDPDLLKASAFGGAAPDPEKARMWYGKAAILGAPQAKIWVAEHGLP